MSGTPLITGLLTLLLVSGCTVAAPTPQDQPGNPDLSTRLIAHVWRITSPSDRAPGSVYAFHPDGTLMMTSCVEVYRIAQWHLNPSGTLTIAEDPTVTYEADIVALSDSGLSLRLHLRNEQVMLQFAPLPAPYVCMSNKPGFLSE